ncbi:phosphotransferase family protein [Rhodococcus sp. NPDC019627]|uniref:phosphotransferase family protein n=1 Tax=unclassified Rhodococcus (in: high G+C Gram-positive bacteria) TaxID=192944 RepID=UPI00340D22BF
MPATMVSTPRRLSGGASRETWAVDVRIGDRTGDTVGLVYRGQFGEQKLAASLREEHLAMTALYQAGQPVPRPYPAPSETGDMAFMVMERAAGVDLRKAMSTLSESVRSALRVQLMNSLVRIHGIDADRVFPYRGGYEYNVDSQLHQWILPILADDTAIDVPLLKAAARRLDAFRPADGPVCLLHGDFKANNILVEGGRMTAILDWELCHVGDPLEDLAWTRLWTTRWDVIGGLFDSQEFLDQYANSSGTEIDPERFAYWELFSWVKLAMILRRQGQEAQEAGSSPMLAQLGRSVAHCEVHIAARLGAIEGATS